MYKSDTCEKEIKVRVIQARKVITCLNGILWSTDLTKNTKLCFKNNRKIIFIYGAENWTMTGKMKEKILAIEMDELRTSMRI